MHLIKFIIPSLIKVSEGFFMFVSTSKFKQQLIEDQLNSYRRQYNNVVCELIELIDEKCDSNKPEIELLDKRKIKLIKKMKDFLIKHNLKNEFIESLQG